MSKHPRHRHRERRSRRVPDRAAAPPCWTRCATSLRLTGTKEGCGSGDCGACSVIVDGRLVCSCLMLAAEAEGQRIETIEGMAEGGELHPLQHKFLEHAALQCGFCTPGLLVAAKALLDANPDPSESETRYWLAGNLCRCTGYDKVIRAVLDAAAEMRGGSRGMTDVGKPRPTCAEGRRHPAGPSRRRRQGDRPRRVRRRLRHARHARGARSSAARTRTRASSRSTPRSARAARREGGGHGRRLPGPRLGGMRGSARAPRTCATCRSTAWRAARRSTTATRSPPSPPSRPRSPTRRSTSSRSTTRCCRTSSTSRRRWRPDAPLLHDHLFTAGLGARRPRTPSNIAKRDQFPRGDLEAGFADADVVVEGRYATGAGAPGLHRAARLRRQLGRRRPVPGLELEPGPVHGPHLLRQAAGLELSDIRVDRRPRSAAASAARPLVYLEPLALALSRKSGAPVKMVMTPRGGVPRHRPHLRRRRSR